MKVSIIIPTKNPGAIFKKVLEIALNQITEWDYIVYVIDSGSTDGTIQHLKEIRSERLVIEQINSSDFGHGRTRNYAISKCDSEFIALITQDALPINEYWLMNLVKLIQSNEKIAGVFGRHIAYESASLFVKRDIDRIFISINKNGNMYQITDQLKYKNDQNYRKIMHFFSDNNACLRKSVWEKYPYPDIEFAEDQIWAKIILEAGYIKAYSHEAAVYHSHDFSIWEKFQRNYDESEALNKLFGYIFVPGILAFIRLSILRSGYDLLYFIITRKKRFIDIYWLLRMPIDNILRAVAFLLGQNHSIIPSKIKKYISRDRGLKNK